MAPRRTLARPKDADQSSEGLYTQLNHFLKTKSPKGTTVYKMTEARADKVAAFVDEHPLKDSCSPPPVSWCRKLIANLSQKNWRMTVKDVKTWHKYSPHLFKPKAIMGSPASSTSSDDSDKSLFTPVLVKTRLATSSKPGPSSTIDTADDEVVVVDVVMKTASSVPISYTCPYGKTHELYFNKSPFEIATATGSSPNQPELN